MMLIYNATIAWFPCSNTIQSFILQLPYRYYFNNACVFPYASCVFPYASSREREGAMEIQQRCLIKFSSFKEPLCHCYRYEHFNDLILPCWPSHSWKIHILLSHSWKIRILLSQSSWKMSCQLLRQRRVGHCRSKPPYYWWDRITSFHHRSWVCHSSWYWLASTGTCKCPLLREGKHTCVWCGGVEAAVVASSCPVVDDAREKAFWWSDVEAAAVLSWRSRKGLFQKFVTTEKAFWSFRFLLKKVKSFVAGYDLIFLRKNPILLITRYTQCRTA